MANVSKLIFGVAIATVTIATPALATHRGFLLIRMDMSHEAAKDVAFIILSGLASYRKPPDPKSWVGDPASRPYVYVPGQASGGGGF